VLFGIKLSRVLSGNSPFKEKVSPVTFIQVTVLNYLKLSIIWLFLFLNINIELKYLYLLLTTLLFKNPSFFVKKIQKNNKALQQMPERLYL